MSLYRRLAGPAWARLAGTVRAFHSDWSAVRGRFVVRRGLLGRLMPLPPPGIVPGRLTVERRSGAERWLRNFGGRRFASEQWADGGLLVERVGVIELRFALTAVDGGLDFVQRGAALRLGPLRVPLPRWIAPQVRARERPTSHGVRVSVRIGGIAEYDGVVEAA